MALSLILGLVAATPAAAVDDEAVRTAIVSAVEARVGRDARVTVRDLVVRVPADAAGSVFATVPADARGGATVRVVLKTMKRRGQVTRYGEATCILGVTTRGLRAARALRRGTVLSTGDVAAGEVDLDGVILRALPVDAEGARVLSDVAAGEVLQDTTLRSAPLVRAGQDVRVTISAGGLLVQGRAVAAQAGRRGDVIRVVNPDSGRRLAGRVVGRGEIEVRHGS